EFSHGSIGVNNLVRLSMFIKERKRNAAEFNFFDKTIACIMQQYYIYTLPSFRKLIVILPFKWSLSYLQLNIYFLILSINTLMLLYNLKVAQKYILEKILQYSASFIENFEKTKWKYYSLVKTNVSNVINELIEHKKSELKENKIQIIKNNLDDYLPSVIIPQNKLYTIIDNILSNAVEALQHSKISSPVIEINVPKSNLLNLTLLISNNGAKIESDIASHIFQPITTTKEQGGFGLYEAKQIANSFLGDVKLVDSTEYKTTFSITLRTYYNA
ncbi:MAG: HAMP domain-containing sensor histidine kinase, partial [Bacteroidota bacterium]